jgi:plastocyanin
MKKMITLMVTAAATMLLATSLPGGPAGGKTSPDTVKIDNFNFTPQTLTVRAGTTVLWVNQDDVPHTVTSNDKKFKSRVLDTDERFSYTFSVPGTYNYYCSVHPHMTGKVIVQ